MSRKQPSEDFIGKKYNRLTIIQDLGYLKKDRTVMTLCDCGNLKPIILLNIKKGITKSCGCLAI